MYKRALHAFFLKVHPDFFQAHKTAQTTNERSIAQLNELLGWAKEFKAGTPRPPPASSIPFTFYRQAEEDKSSSGDKKDNNRSEVLQTVSSRFELPVSFSPTDANRGVVERAVNRFLRELLRKANCIDHTTEAASIADDAEAERMEVKPLRRRVHDTTRRKKAQKTKTLLDEASESLAEQWGSSHAAPPSVEELMEADQLLLSRTLSPLHSAVAMETLAAYLPEMQYEVWSSMPLIISDAWAVGEITGAISVPWNFTPNQFVAFLHNHSKEITQCQDQAINFAKRVEGLVSTICRELSMDDVLVSCSHREAIPALELLRVQCPVLRYNNITGVTLEIGDDFGFRDNGVIIISKMANPETMRAAIHALKPRMHLQQQLYALSKKTLDSIQWHIKETHANLRCRGLMAFDNDNTYAERLAWAKELFKCSPQLAQWDWSGFVFMLGEIDVDWHRQVVSLPHDFDGKSFVRYVEDVHRAAKEKKRHELVKDTVQQQHIEEAIKRASQNGGLLGSGNQSSLHQPNSVEGKSIAYTTIGAPMSDSTRSMIASSGGGDLQNTAAYNSRSKEMSQVPAEVLHSVQREMVAPSRNLPPVDPRAARYPGLFLRSGATIPLVATSASSEIDGRRETLREVAPYMEEYIASSPTGDDQHSVERPLHHNLLFDSDSDGERDAVAADNLAWEGFHEEPYMNAIPNRELEDVFHAYAATQRNYREAAVKKLVSELQETLGTGHKDRFKGARLGDISKLNDPNSFPRGFNKKPKGTAAGDSGAFFS